MYCYCLSVVLYVVTGTHFQFTVLDFAQLYTSRWLFIGDCSLLVSVSFIRYVLALDLEGVHDVKLHHPSSSVATSNQ